MHVLFKRRKGGTPSPVRAMFLAREKMARSGHAGQKDVTSGLREALGSADSWPSAFKLSALFLLDARSA